MSIIFDEHGQPVPRLNALARHRRAVNEMLGLVRGILADDIVTESEGKTLGSWLAANPDAATRFPGTVLVPRLQRIFSDGVVAAEEQQELASMLTETIGQEREDGGTPTQLPFTTPAPRLMFEGSVFVVTGRFLYGARKLVQEVVCSRGARCESDVTMRTNVLLVGTFGSRDWAHSSFGTKIEKAVRLREKGSAIDIVAEDHWVTFL